ncbi:hypothetical protein [Streptomyces sp.]|uniref:hypothetical protein n=1 Tax=Streptomyces sp. TaxID=1931 RepID=UPI002F933BB9
MSWIIALTVLLVLIAATEKSERKPFARVRDSRIYQGGRRRTIDVGRAAWGRGPRNGRPVSRDLPRNERPASRPELPDRDRRRDRRAAIAYDPPPARPEDAPSATVSSASGNVTVDFFQGILTLISAPYEGPNDALRQLKALAEGGRQWNNGLIGMHQRMSDPGDMRIDPFVSDHVVRAAALGQAMVLELVEADAAMTALLNMTLAELTERGLWIPNAKSR